MPENDHIKFMRRCLDLASKAEGMTYPNPLVGSVLEYKGKIIGEGFHLRAGEPHAEVNAINSVREKQLLPDSVLYVNLEPCSHYGKTPPCADLIIRTGIRKVVIGTRDTSKKVNGEGILRLQDAGCEVITGILEDECRWINRRFFCFNEKARPYVVLKWAQSADGFIGKTREPGHSREPVWIIGKAERALVHRWRASEQAIMAGAATIRTDNSRLNVRDWAGKDPVRIVLSGSGELDPGSDIFSTDGTNIVFTYNIKDNYVNSLKVILEMNRSAIAQIIEYLFQMNIQSVIIEGGRKVLEQFISEDLWDEARIFHGEVKFTDGIPAPVINGGEISKLRFRNSTLEIIHNEATHQSLGIAN